MWLWSIQKVLKTQMSEFPRMHPKSCFDGLSSQRLSDYDHTWVKIYKSLLILRLQFSNSWIRIVLVMSFITDFLFLCVCSWSSGRCTQVWNWTSKLLLSCLYMFKTKQKRHERNIKSLNIYYFDVVGPACSVWAEQNQHLCIFSQLPERPIIKCVDTRKTFKGLVHPKSKILPLSPPPDDIKSGEVSSPTEQFWSFIVKQSCSILLNNWSSWTFRNPKIKIQNIKLSPNSWSCVQMSCTSQWPSSGTV